jgi:hypothetical protein
MGVKFIDMRGKVGEVLTVKGDEVYDWAKLYQSIIGYDEVLLGLTVSSKYRQGLLTHFWEELNRLSPDTCPGDVKLVTQSHLFSLLPLHSAEDEQEKQKQYFKLINEV